MRAVPKVEAVPKKVEVAPKALNEVVPKKLKSCQKGEVVPKKLKSH